MKKAEIGTVVTAIIFIVSAILLIVFGKAIIDTLNKDIDRNDCKDSVFAQSVTTLRKDFGITTVEASLLNYRCPRYQITFFPDHVDFGFFKGKKLQTETYEISLPYQQPTKKISQLNNQIVNHVLAEELKWCWWQFHEGKLHLFRSEKSLIFNDFGDNDEMCFVCNEIRFSPEVAQKEFTGFFDYINITKVPGKEYTYYDYIAGLNNQYCYKYADKPNCWEAFIADHAGIAREPVFDTSQTYTIVFMRMGQDPLADTYFSYLLPYSELNKQCNVQAT
ncbi:hypothetical protein C4573_01230 [Candidatus Woesearchaeota archaeon]|nr:MAG: hypothetical protein C4573_01230 [Candidatus Woesearchaeota archaeon]